MISKVVKSSWTNPNGKMGFCYRVYYPNRDSWRKDRVVTYTDQQNLPLTVLNYVVNANNCNTVYVPDRDVSGMRGLKRETYSN